MTLNDAALQVYRGHYRTAVSDPIRPYIYNHRDEESHFLNLIYSHSPPNEYKYPNDSHLGRPEVPVNHHWASPMAPRPGSWHPHQSTHHLPVHNCTTGSRSLKIPHATEISASPSCIVSPSGSPLHDTSDKNVSPHPRSTSPEHGWELGTNDIVCGRGAPASYHHKGNQLFRELVKEYQTVYLCSKRSDKPQIARDVLEVIRSRGARFLRRAKVVGTRDRFLWEELDQKKAYEKTCQALREGAPELRRKLMASSSKMKGRRELESCSPIQC